MYQYWLQTADDDAVRYLKLFTFLDRDRIGELAVEVETHPESVRRNGCWRPMHRHCPRRGYGARGGSREPHSVLGIERSSDGGDGRHAGARDAGHRDDARELDSRVVLVDLLVRTHLAESKARHGS